MRAQNPMANTGFVGSRRAPIALGTCFFYRWPSYVITAAHCVNQSSPADLFIEIPSIAFGKRFQVSAIHLHPIADAAILKVESITEADITWTWNQAWQEEGLGIPVMSYGYPLDFVCDGSEVPTTRLFIGYIQRFFQHKSRLGFAYEAAEVSYRAPRGLSGSAVFNTQLHGRLYGIITENIQIGTEISSIVNIEENGKEYREQIRDTKNFGVSLWLPAITNWIDSVIPPVSVAEELRRAENQHKSNR
jgi:hypothetical protein